MLRNGGGQGRDDGAGVLVRAELERDGGANDRRLPLQWHRQRPHPVAPIVRGLAQHAPGRAGEVGLEPLVGPQEQGDRLLQPKNPLLQDMAHRPVGGQPQRRVAAHIADVVGAVGGARPRRAIVDGGPQLDADTRRTLHRPDQPHEGQRPVEPPELPVAGAEVDDLQPRAGGVGDLGPQDRGVAQVALIGVGAVDDLDGPKALGVLVVRIAATEQG